MNLPNNQVFNGPLVFKGSTPIVHTPNYTISRIYIPKSSSDLLGDFYTPTTTKDFSIEGVRQCNNLKYFNNPIIETPTSTNSPTGTILNYESYELIDECTELSFQRKLNSFYIKQEL